MKPDWDVVDPEDRDSLPDEATVIRELRRIRRRRIAGWIGRGLFMGFAIYLLWPLIGSVLRRGDDMRLIAAGSGEIRYRGTGISCRPRPGLGGRNFNPPSIEAPLEVVARENGWALTGYRGQPCWLPEWALRATPLSWDEWRRCGEACETKAPPGWFAAQAEATCPFGVAGPWCVYPRSVEQLEEEHEAGNGTAAGPETTDGR